MQWTNYFSNIDATYLRDHILRFCLIYIDEFLVYWTNFTQHLYHLYKVFNAIRVTNPKTKLTKCYFASRSVDILDHHVSELGIEPNNCNIDAVSKFLAPTNVKQSSAFLGRCFSAENF